MRTVIFGLVVLLVGCVGKYPFGIHTTRGDAFQDFMSVEGKSVINYSNDGILNRVECKSDQCKIEMVTHEGGTISPKMAEVVGSALILGTKAGKAAAGVP